MMCRDNCTFYFAQGGGFLRVPVEGVHWEERPRERPWGSLPQAGPAGGPARGTVSVWVPVHKLPREAFAGVTRGGRRRCYLVRGIVEETPLEAAEKEFVQRHAARLVTGIARHDYGALALRHWEITAD